MDARNRRQPLLNKTRGAREPLQDMFKAVRPFRRRSQTNRLSSRQQRQYVNQRLGGNVMHFVNDDCSKSIQQVFRLVTIGNAINRADGKITI